MATNYKADMLDGFCYTDYFQKIINNTTYIKHIIPILLPTLAYPPQNQSLPPSHPASSISLPPTTSVGVRYQQPIMTGTSTSLTSNYTARMSQYLQSQAEASATTHILPIIS